MDESNLPPEVVSRLGVVLAAGGSGTRFGSRTPKTLLDCAGQPLWRWSANLFATLVPRSRIVVVVPASHREKFGSDFPTIVGGRSRAESVACGLTYLAEQPNPPSLVAVHDAARPAVDRSDVARVCEAAATSGAAILAQSVASTVKRANDDLTIVETVPRDRLWLAQTPQVARFDWLHAALTVPNASEATDEAGALERCGHTVSIVPGSPLNRKVTTPEDLAFAELVLRSRDDHAQAAEPAGTLET